MCSNFICYFAQRILQQELSQLRDNERSKSEALENARGELAQLKDALTDREHAIVEAEARSKEKEEAIAALRGLVRDNDPLEHAFREFSRLTARSPSTVRSPRADYELTVLYGKLVGAMARAMARDKVHHT